MRRNLTKSYWLQVVLLILLSWVQPKAAMASTVLTEDYNWMVVPGGTESVRLTLGLYDKDGRDTWVEHGYVYVSVEGIAEDLLLLYYEAEQNISDGDKWNDAKWKSEVAGTVTLFRPGYNNQVVTSNLTKIPIYNSSDLYKVDLEWTVPYKYRGKKLTIKVDVDMWQHLYKHWYFKKNYEVTTSAPPKQEKPEVMLKTLAMDEVHKMKTRLMWQIPVTEVLTAEGYYTDFSGTEHVMALEKSTFGDFYLPCDQPLKNVYVKVTYKDSEGNIIPQKSDDPPVVSDPIEMPMFHQAKNPSVALRDDGSAVVSWQIDYVGYSDVMDTDMWMIARNTDYNPSDPTQGSWDIVGEEVFDVTEGVYTFIDETLPLSYTGKPVAYRIQRGTGVIWGWDSSAGGVETALLQHMKLPRILSASVQKTDLWDDKHQILVNWTMSKNPSSYDTNTLYIYNNVDWNLFVSMTNSGNSNVNAKLMADLDISSNQRMVAEDINSPYTGTFDGNGHTLTYHFNQAEEKTEAMVGLFRYVKGATIRNLHISGSIKSDNRAIGSLIGNALAETTTVECCHSSVSIETSYDGDASLGGFVANVRDYATVTLRNCLFDGQFNAPEASRSGGFVGWVQNYATANLENCLFDPISISMTISDCYTFGRQSNVGTKVNTQNSYYTKILGYTQGYPATTATSEQLITNLGKNWHIVDGKACPILAFIPEQIASKADWLKIVKKVNAGEEIHAVLTADIDLGTITTDNKDDVVIGSYSAPFVGSVDGQGHKITIANTTSSNYSVPVSAFGFVKDATISNLTVEGNINNNNGITTSFVAVVNNGGRLKLSNCRSSARLKAVYTTYRNSFGGLISQVRDGATVEIENCLFDGSLQGSGYGFGGFVGQRIGKAVVTISNSLLNITDWPSQASDVDATFVSDDGNGNGVTNIINSYYRKAFGKIQGEAIDDMTSEQLIAKLGSGWMIQGNNVVPTVATTDSDADNTIYVWDEANAQMTLYTDMYVEGKLTYTNKREVTKEEREARLVKLNLTRSCVDYNFRLAVERNGSPFVIDGKDDNVQTDEVMIGTPLAFDAIKIETEADWDAFARRVNDGETRLNALLKKDLTLTNKNVLIGASQSHAYRGIFDGHGHTITVEFGPEAAERIALFPYVSDATIKNLNIKGRILINYGRPGSLIATVYATNGYTKTVIENCHSSVIIESAKDVKEYNLYYGGFVGETSTNVSLEMNNCVFDGQFIDEENFHWGGIVGCAYGYGAKILLKNCLYNPIAGATIVKGATLAYPFEDYVTVTIENCYYTNKQNADILQGIDASSMTDEELTAALGYDWHPITTTDDGSGQASARRSAPRRAASVPETFYYDTNAVLTNLEIIKRHSSVMLRWQTNEGDVDYFTIKRRDRMALETDTFEIIQANYHEYTYEDKTVQPLHDYDYIVESTVHCEGKHCSELKATGQCEPFGRVSGYVRMFDGTAIAGKKVTATADPSVPNGVIRSTYTDQTGRFVIDSLYYTLEQGKYTVTVNRSGEEAPYDSWLVIFNDETNTKDNHSFYQKNYYYFSGTVLYEGSSIPVRGANFIVDNDTVCNQMGDPITTDNRGEFKIAIAKGKHTVRVVKEGHTFENGGYFLNNGEDKEIVWSNNIAEVYLWDKTKVRLRGRIVGGDRQGSLPLGNSESVNNLGDSIRMVMQLEGDNTSWIVRNQKDETVKERTQVYGFGAIDEKTELPKDTTRMHQTRHSISIFPWEKTGEYYVELFPVKYKVTEISCTGYSTLFQSGKVGETIDLTACHHGDTVEYNRIYHSPVTLEVKQNNITTDNYFGERNYLTMGNSSKENVTLWSKDLGYTMGYPVFMSGNRYSFSLSAQEEYWYNNRKTNRLDIVSLKGGTVYVQNQLVSINQTDSLSLNENGEGVYSFVPKNTTFIGEDENALRSMSITLLYDNTYYDIKPFNEQILKGYVMGAKAIQGSRVSVAEVPILSDILRDPPGANSYSYIEANSKHKVGYNFQLDSKFGLHLESQTGSGANWFDGLYAGGPVSGTTGGVINLSSSKVDYTFDIIFEGGGSWTWNYEWTNTERIQTSSSPKWVGTKADIFMGLTTNAIMEDAISVRVVTDSMYQQMVLRQQGQYGSNYLKSGTLKALASGTNEKGKIWLVRDEVLSVSTELKSFFAHTTEYIENELIPSLIQQRNELMLPNTISLKDAEAMAARDKKTYYLSKVDASDPKFGVEYTICKKPNASAKDPDEVNKLNQLIKSWVEILAHNEKEKLNPSAVADVVKTYDFDGAANIQYSESYTSSTDYTRYFHLPFLTGGTVNFKVSNLGGLLESILNKFNSKPQDGTAEKNVEGNEVHIRTTAAESVLRFFPVLSLTTNDKNTATDADTKKTGFVLSASPKSNLNVTVYRTKLSTDSINKMTKDGRLILNLKDMQDIHDHVRGGVTGAGIGLNWTTYAKNDDQFYGNFIFHTNGGATCSPYEDERRTKYYDTDQNGVGKVYDAKTKAIDNLRIWIDQAIVSNVPYGEPARFTIHLSNETDMPDRSTPIFTIGSSDSNNQKGAKVLIDGYALNSQGYTIPLPGGQVITKQVEVFAGAEYDYEDLGIILYDPNDLPRTQTQLLSAHFVPSAGKINVSTPGDKWVINTESPYDSKEKGWYMPVRIDGFDVTFPNFDHIELQYKLSTQGEKDWVNTCSFYKDEQLMAKASGVRELIKNDGYISTQFFGEIDPIEQYYDLRAVVYCRYGNGFLTSSSPVLSGIKDTRLPQAFGTPKPINGILDIGDDINITFSEPIASNYLSKVNNFEVLGSTNKTDISLSTCLHFNGTDFAYTQASRDLAGKSFTVDLMLYPGEHDKNMAVMSHGDDSGHILILGLTADNRMCALIDSIMFIGTRPVEFKSLKQVNYVFEVVKDSLTKVTFYDGNESVGGGTMAGRYFGNGKILVGDYIMGDGEKWMPYVGDMLEMRLWSKALKKDEIDQYAQKRLTGYELGLVDNYPMSEGKGNYCYDRAVGGAHLELIGTTWKVPAGLSLRLDGEKGVRLNPEPFSRDSYHDYTLMFWFRTTDFNGALLSNGLARLEKNWKDHFNIGINEGCLYYRSGNREVQSDSYVSDGMWHHVAVTVNRARNVGNLYIDQKLKQSFAVDTLGGIRGDYLAAGAVYENTSTVRDALKGNIDELAMYEMTLPTNIIESFANMTPSGRELGTMVYLPFSRSEKLGNNQQRLMPYGLSIMAERDNQGNYSTRRDTIVTPEVMEAMGDRTNYAPMKNMGNVENLHFSYVADKQNLLINLDEPDVSLEKSNVYIIVKEVADLNGNLMASPIVMNLFVYRNPLRWSEKRKTVEVVYGEETVFQVKLSNLSGQTRNYRLEDLPQWITASKTSGVIEALDEETLTFTISPYINIGDFNEKINLVGDEGMNEPLPIYIKVRGEAPQWEVSQTLKDVNITMNMVSRVVIDGTVADNPENLVGVFGPGHETLGVAHINVDNSGNANEALTYIVIYSPDGKETPLQFEYYDALTGRISILDPNPRQTVYFKTDSIIGTDKDPLILINDKNKEVQTLRLKKGWNWLSFYLLPEKNTIGNLLDQATKWEVGDAFEFMPAEGENKTLFTYMSERDPKVPTKYNYAWDHRDMMIELYPQLRYRFYSNSDKTAYITGEYYLYYLTINQGWNRIGFPSKLNLPIATAMADYTDKGSIGDMIKSQNEFSVLTEVGGVRLWKGTLTNLESGQGYMLKHNDATTVEFSYPSFSSKTRFGNDPYRSRALSYDNVTGQSMNVIARTLGVDVQPGDRLVAYQQGEICGMAEMTTDSLFFLSIGEVVPKAGISFTIERNGELVAATGEQMKYVSNDVKGTLSEPTVIDFIGIDRFADGSWYDMQGRKLSRRPVRKGVYIFNGQKTFIE